jgi:site-specific recombinase XerD
MSPQLEVVLKLHLASHPFEALLCNSEGKRLNARGELQKLMRRFRIFFPTDGKNSWGSHSLRHSFAYNFLRKGEQMYQLQAILGHRSIDVTVDLYGQLQAQDVACPSPYEDSFGREVK